MIKTPEKRLQNLLAYFGYAGGTIHQMAKLTGVDSYTLLYGKPEKTYLASDYSLGSCALETCGKDWRVNHLAGRRFEVIDYWLGVADALQVCEG